MSTRDDYFDVFDAYLPVGLAVFALFCALIAFVVWRGQRRSAPPSTQNNNITLEVVYVGLLAIAAGALLALTLTVNGRESNADAGRNAERIDVVAAKWHWRFEYPRYGIVQQGTDRRFAQLIVPRGVPIVFRGNSLDVIHDFWVPKLRFQRELFNDRVSAWKMTFTADDQGGNAPCAFFCGFGHKTMRFDVRVLSPDDFRAWVNSRRPA